MSTQDWFHSSANPIRIGSLLANSVESGLVGTRPESRQSERNSPAANSQVFQDLPMIRPIILAARAAIGSKTPISSRVTLAFSISCLQFKDHSCCGLYNKQGKWTNVAVPSQ